jgi:hypothetical protein
MESFLEREEREKKNWSTQWTSLDLHNPLSFLIIPFLWFRKQTQPRWFGSWQNECELILIINFNETTLQRLSDIPNVKLIFFYGETGNSFLRKPWLFHLCYFLHNETICISAKSEEKRTGGSGFPLSYLQSHHYAFLIPFCSQVS